MHIQLAQEAAHADAVQNTYCNEYYIRSFSAQGGDGIGSLGGQIVGVGLGDR